MRLRFPSSFPYAFRPKAWAVALAAAACAAFIGLGEWQRGRAEEKRAAAAPERAALKGELLAAHTVLLDNKLLHGRPGYHVVQPLRLASGRHVLINRGWIAAGASREQLPQVRTPDGAVDIAGVKRARLPQAYAPGGAKPAGRVWQNVTLEDFAAWSGLALEPYVIEQHSDLADGLERDWPAAGVPAEKHLAYALQWYSLAALAVILLLVLSLRRDGAAAG